LEFKYNKIDRQASVYEETSQQAIRSNAF